MGQEQTEFKHKHSAGICWVLETMPGSIKTGTALAGFDHCRTSAKESHKALCWLSISIYLLTDKIQGRHSATQKELNFTNTMEYYSELKRNEL